MPLREDHGLPRISVLKLQSRTLYSFPRPSCIKHNGFLPWHTHQWARLRNVAVDIFKRNATHFLICLLCVLLSLHAVNKIETSHLSGRDVHVFNVSTRITRARRSTYAYITRLHLAASHLFGKEAYAQPQSVGLTV